MKELDTKEMDNQELELYRMLRSKFNDKEMERLAKLMIIDGEKYHQEQLKKNCVLDLVSVPLNIQEELFNAGFDEGYTNPMELNGRVVTEKEYEEGRKHNFNQWVNER
jgi:hypothetical protein